MERINDKKRIEIYMDRFDLRGVIKKKYIERMELHKYRRGDIIYHMKDEFRYLYFLVEGKVLVHLHTADGKEMHLDFGEPLDLLGDLEYISSSGIYSNVEAIKDSYLLAMPRDVVDDNAKDNCKFYEMISKFLGQKLRKTSKKYTEMILYPLKNRIATYIYELAGDEALIEGFRQGEVALSYGISDRHLRRILGELEEEGIIAKKRGVIEVLNRSLLKEYCIDEEITI